MRQLLADAKVRDLAPNYAAALGYQHVARLQVAVHDAVRVEVRQSRGDVASHMQNVLVDEWPALVLVDHVVEVVGHQLGNDVDAGARYIGHAVDDEHVLMGKVGHDR